MVIFEYIIKILPITFLSLDIEYGNILCCVCWAQAEIMIFDLNAKKMLFSIRGVYTNDIIVKNGLSEQERYINQDGRESMNLLHPTH